MQQSQGNRGKYPLMCWLRVAAMYGSAMLTHRLAVIDVGGSVLEPVGV